MSNFMLTKTYDSGIIIRNGFLKRTVKTVHFPYQNIPGTASIRPDPDSSFRDSISHKDYGQLTTFAPGAKRYNRAVRDDYVLLITGNEPFAALSVTNPEHTENPFFHVLGHLELDGAGSVTDTVFHPHGTEWIYDSGTVLRTAIYPSGFAAEISVTAPLRLTVRFGQMQLISDHFRSAYMNCGEGDLATHILSSEDGSIRLSAPEDSPIYETGLFRVYADVLPAAGGNYAEYDIEVNPGESCFLCACCAEKGGLPETPDEVSALIRMSCRKYDKLLDSCRVCTPDTLADAGFRHAVLNLEYGHVGMAWYEGCHWWNTYFTDNYQISAAIALGQYDRARRALKFFAEHPEGYAPLWSDGSQKKPEKQSGTDCVPMNYDGAPYYIYQLYEYVMTTGDKGLFYDVSEWLFDMLNCFEQVQYRDGFWGFPMGCNPFLYQADMLGQPYASASVTLFMSGMYERLSELCRACGLDYEAGRFKKKSKRSLGQSMRLWDEDKKCFAGHMDFQYKRHHSHYYTDFVFPALYTGLPVRYTDGPLAQLRSRLLTEGPYGNTLMHVGTLKPEGFGNDNIMPVQMAEAAGALLENCDAETGRKLLDGVALAATVFTEAPGNFPERMGDDGKGEADYLFGNPAAAYAYRYIHSLFGLSVTDLGQTLCVRPCFPADWNAAELHLPCAALMFRADGTELRYTVTPSRRYRKIRFECAVPHCSHITADVDGIPRDVVIKEYGSGIRVCVEAGGSSAITLHLHCENPIKVSPGAAPFEPEEELLHVYGLPEGGRFEDAEPVRLDCLTDTLTFARTAWRREDAMDLRLDTDNGILHTPWCDFEIRHCKNDPAAAGVRGVYDGHYAGTAASFRLVAWGVSEGEARIPRRFSEARRYLRLPVGKNVKAVLPLMVTEAEVRLTDSRVGCIRLVYSDGTVEVTPLIHGQTFTPLVKVYGKKLLAVPLATAQGSCQDSAVILPIRANGEKTLEYLEFEIDTADAFLSLLALNVIVNKLK